MTFYTSSVLSLMKFGADQPVRVAPRYVLQTTILPTRKNRRRAASNGGTRSRYFAGNLAPFCV
jgi:hypothetical protein